MPQRRYIGLSLRNDLLFELLGRILNKCFKISNLQCYVSKREPNVIQMNSIVPGACSKIMSLTYTKNVRSVRGSFKKEKTLTFLLYLDDVCCPHNIPSKECTLALADPDRWFVWVILRLQLCTTLLSRRKAGRVTFLSNFCL